MNDKSVENKAQKRQMRFTLNELDLLHRLFNENKVLLKAIRKRFLQLPILESDKELLKSTFSSQENFDVLEKVFNPKLDPEAPILQLVDMWLNVEIKDKDTATAMPFILAREIMCGYIDRFFERLTESTDYFGELEKLLIISDELTPIETHANILARNNLLAHCEAQLNQIVILANLGAPKDEKVKEDAKKDSAQ